MGPKLVNCCRPEQKGTKEFGKMMKQFKFSRKEESQPKRQRFGELMEKRRNDEIRGC